MPIFSIMVTDIDATEGSTAERAWIRLTHSWKNFATKARPEYDVIVDAHSQNQEGKTDQLETRHFSAKMVLERAKIKQTWKGINFSPKRGIENAHMIRVRTLSKTIRVVAERRFVTLTPAKL